VSKGGAVPARERVLAPAGVTEPWVYVRKGIVMEAGLYLARAVTIAVRYSCVRRQFGGAKGVHRGRRR